MNALQRLHSDCENALTEIKRNHLKPHMELTLVIRNPEVEDGNIIITKDEMEQVVGVLAKEISRKNFGG